MAFIRKKEQKVVCKQLKLKLQQLVGRRIQKVTLGALKEPRSIVISMVQSSASSKNIH
jgi:hypothetical protein